MDEFIQGSSTASDFDDIPDPFADAEVDWDTLLGSQPTQTTQPETQSVGNDFEDIADIFANVDVDWDNLLSTPLPPTSQLSLATEPPSSFTSLKRQRSVSPPPSSAERRPLGPYNSPPKKRQKSPEPAAKLLEGFEDELTCAICCDLLAAAHLLNPCGHSFCGECVSEWISVKVRKTTCPVCRAIIAKQPMAPNISLDKLVDVHVRMLGMNDTGWKEGGEKLAELDKRRRTWKNRATARARQDIVSHTVWVIDDEESDESEDYDEDEEFNEEDLDDIVWLAQPPH
ncbi:RING finger protein 8 [Mycena indigotica]|uniref:RING finger protein 8 n=1 Tax=Mycena indigotica TaxID=2126181 RepID=A0A8H6SWW9_9AGAR|nr:RING finger protein 8 [Mycena indigotica]KAF7306630.1 RING finger protein 8 [Mycena indigotica]